MKSLKDLHGSLIDYLHDGKFVEGIKDFYAENAIIQENSQPVTNGRDEMADKERRFQKKVSAFHGIEVHDTVIDDQGDGNGVVFYETTMKWKQSDRPDIVEVDQTVVERWKDGKIESIRFYGDYDPGELPG